MEDNGNIDNVAPESNLNPTTPSLLETTSEPVVETTHPSDVVEEATATDNSEMLTFIEGLDDVTKQDEYLKRFESPKELAKSYVELRKLVGRKAEVPKEDASSDEWNEFYGKIGRPETAEGYEIQMLEGLTDDGRLGDVLNIAHEAGLTKTQASKVVNALMEQELSAVKNMTEIQSQNIAAESAKLKEAWGNAHDDMVTSIINLQESLGLKDTFDAKGLNGDADFLMFMAQVADKFTESETVISASANTPSGLDDQISEIMAEIREYNIKGDTVPDHLAKRKSDLFKKRYG